MSKMTKWLIHVWGDVEPQLYGPFETDNDRDEVVREINEDEGKDAGCMIELEIDATGVPSVEPYSGGEMMEIMGEEIEED